MYVCTCVNTSSKYKLILGLLITGKIIDLNHSSLGLLRLTAGRKQQTTARQKQAEHAADDPRSRKEQHPQTELGRQGSRG